MSLEPIAEWYVGGSLHRFLADKDRCSLVSIGADGKEYKILPTMDDLSAILLAGKKGWKPMVNLTPESHFQGIKVPGPLATKEFMAAFADWANMRKERGKKLTPISISRSLAKLESWGLSMAIASLNQSADNGWLGLFPPQQQRGGEVNRVTKDLSKVRGKYG